MFTTAEALPTTKRIELIKEKKFVATTLSSNEKTFIVHIAALNFNSNLKIDLFCRAQLAFLLTDNTPIVIFLNTVTLSPFFFLKFAVKFPEYTGINNYSINLVDGQQPSYMSIYSLKFVELESLKIYIKTNLANSFI